MFRLPPAALILAIPLLSILPSKPAQSGPCAVENHNPYDGYRWPEDRSVCVPSLISIHSWYTPAPPYAYGSAVWYDPYLMEATARYRHLDLTNFVDGVALMSPADIGRTVWLRRPGHDWEGPFLVADSARRTDIWPVIAHRGEIVEVGFRTAVAWGMVDATELADGNPGRPYVVNQWKVRGVEVLKMDDIPPWIALYEPLPYVRWWTERAHFVNPHDFRRPYQLEPDSPKFPGWKWMASDPPVEINAYDNWFEFLWPGDSRFEFKLPLNWRANEPVPTACYSANLNCLGPK
jgi:hypothetical protein